MVVNWLANVFDDAIARSSNVSWQVYAICRSFSTKQLSSGPSDQAQVEIAMEKQTIKLLLK
jgi:hypothetical protein